MIVDFTIENFRSLKTEQLFSLSVEHPKKYLLDNVAFPADDKIGVLRSAGIYGANASGKSNIIRALQALQYIACMTGDLKDGQRIPCYEPFMLSAVTAHAPIKLDIEFVLEGIRYRYTVSYLEHEIVEESLDFYPSRVKANIFRRNSGDTWESIAFGGLYKGGSRRIAFFKNNSYLAKAGNNASASALIRNVYNYLYVSLRPKVDMDTILGPSFRDESALKFAGRFLCNVDTGIHEVAMQVSEKAVDPNLSNLIPEEIRNAIIERAKYRYIFSHKTEEGGVENFRIEKESEGTQRLFAMLPVLFKSIKEGHVFIVDEIDASLHPHIAEMIVRLFNDPEINKNNAQLIFSTHNISLMDSEHLRRDQIWFVEKQAGASELYCLAEFDKDVVKSNSPFGVWYKEGRFGALPKINYSAIRDLLKGEIVIAPSSLGN